MCKGALIMGEGTLSNGKGAWIMGEEAEGMVEGAQAEERCLALAAMVMVSGGQLAKARQSLSLQQPSLKQRKLILSEFELYCWY